MLGMRDLNVQIRDLIESFVEDLSERVRQAALESVRASFGGAQSRAKRGPGRPPKALGASRRSKGQKRDPKELEALVSRLNSAIKSKPGLRIEEIAKGLGTTTKELALPAKKLIAEKMIRTTGNRRATKYFPK